MEEPSVPPPSDPDRDDRPRASIDLRSIGGFRVLGASVLGRGHAHQRRPRDDAFALSGDPDAMPPWWFAAVADGAGSRPLSRFAATAVTDAAAGHAREQLAGGAGLSAAMLGAVERARAAQRAVATQRAVDVGEMSCTLLCVACTLEPSRVNIVTFQIGDGLIAVADPQGNLQPLARADDDTPGQTRFLEMLDDPAARIRVEELFGPVQGILLATDGVADDLIPLAANGPILAHELHELSALPADAGERLGLLLDYEKRGSFDDRTLVIAWWPGAR